MFSPAETSTNTTNSGRQEKPAGEGWLAKEALLDPALRSKEAQAALAAAPPWYVVIYTRLSKNRAKPCRDCNKTGKLADGADCARCEGTGKVKLSESTARQLAECRRWAAAEARRRGRTLVIVDFWEEDDTSASKFSDDPRPKWDLMLALIRADRVQTVLATESERLCRRPLEGHTLITLAETTHLAELAFSGDDLTYDLSRAEGIFQARESFNRSERESNKMSQRIRRTKADQAAQGIPNGGQRAFGYTADGKNVVPAEKKWLDGIAERFTDGWSYTDIATWLNDSGVRTTEGGLWRAINVQLTLSRKRYAGIREHKGVEYPAQWPAIFGRETWNKIQLTMRLRRRDATVTPAKPRYLLTGFLICGKCGSRMGGTTRPERNGPTSYYRCKIKKELGEGCGGSYRSAKALDTYITDMVLGAFESPEFAKLVLSQDDQPADEERLSELLNRREKITERLNALDDEFMAAYDDDDPKAAAARLNRMRDRGRANLDAVDREIDRLNQNRRSLGIVPVGRVDRKTWADASDSWRRERIGMVVNHITVNPTNRKPFYGDTRFRLDTDAIAIDWRF